MSRLRGTTVTGNAIIHHGKNIDDTTEVLIAYSDGCQ